MSTWWATSVDELLPIVESWTLLSESLGKPLSAPQWLLNWWAERPDPRWRLRVLIAEEDGRLAAVLPFYARGRPQRLRLLGQPVGLWGYGLLLNPQSSADVVGALAWELAAAKIGMMLFDALDAADASALQELADRWPAPGVRVVVAQRESTSALRLEGSFDQWVFARGRAWRQGFARRRRRLTEAGGSVRCSSTPAEFTADLENLLAVHDVRWQGHSGWLTPHIERTVRSAVRDLAQHGGVRIQSVELGGKTIAASLSAALGGRTVSLFGGFDRRYPRFGPGILTHASGVEEAFGYGDSLVDFAWADQHYKSQFCNVFGEVAWYEVYPRGVRYPLMRGRQIMLRSRVIQRLRNRRAASGR